MAEVTQILRPEAAEFLTSAIAPPQTRLQSGTNYATYALMFDGSTSEGCFWPFVAVKYPGNVNISVDIYWYANSATSGGVVWEAALAAITPDSDNVGVVAKSFATATTVADTHLGTTAQRLHKATITIVPANNDSLALNDWAVLRIARLPADGSDTMAGDAGLVAVGIRYSDT